MVSPSILKSVITMSRYSRALKTYYDKLDEFASRNVHTEVSIRPAFFNLLDETKPNGWFVEGESSIRIGTRTIRPDAVVKDRYLIRGYYEAKDRHDNLHSEIDRKYKQGYPFKNIIFENSESGILIQNGNVAREIKLREPTQLERLLGDFYHYEEPSIEEFQAAVKRFRQDIPELSTYLKAIIRDAKADTRAFSEAFAQFHELCRQSIDPRLSENTTEEMLVQHLLTERLMRSVFEMDRFNQDNTIAHEIDKAITALAGGGFSRVEFEHRLDYFYRAIEAAAQDLPDFSEKQRFINSVYEDFFQGYASDVADTHGIVYTPQEIVQFMCAAAEEVLTSEFGLNLYDPSVNILDPCTGTGNFIVNLLRRAHLRNPLAIRRMYENQLFANEVMLLPYYIASLNIEHEYYDLTQNWLPFEGLCFVDTLDIDKYQQLGLFSPTNTERVNREKNAQITVVIGNPPYNAGQRNENENNKNRKHGNTDKRVAETYSRDSQATNKNKLSDPYVKFFRWATDRLTDISGNQRDGVVCFVSNNRFIHKRTYDGMRKHLLQDFTRIYHIDLHGDIRDNPQLSGTTHNVFGIQVGVGITIALRSSQHKDRRAYYYRVPEFWRRGEKLAWLKELTRASPMALSLVEWVKLEPDDRNTWLVPQNAAEYANFVPIGSKTAKAATSTNVNTIFKLYSSGIKSNRDEVAYGFSRDTLKRRIEQFAEDYNAEVDRYKRAGKPKDVDNFVRYDRIKWSRDLKLDLVRGNYAEYDEGKIRVSLYRPFNKQYLFLDRILNEEVYVFPHIFPNETAEFENRCIWIKVGTDWGMFPLITNHMVDVLPQGGSQCFPLYTYNEDGSSQRENITDWGLTQFQAHYADISIAKTDIFYYVYGLLHHPEYRTRYADNLKLELPRIPFAPDFHLLCRAGRELAHLHLNYEQVEPYPLTNAYSEDAREPNVWRVNDKMRLDKANGTLKINDMLVLSSIPAQVYDYRLGNRSALEWIVEQYRVKDASDPNSYSDDPRYIVNLVGSIVRVSIETIKIVNELSKLPIV